MTVFRKIIFISLLVQLCFGGISIDSSINNFNINDGEENKSISALPTSPSLVWNTFIDQTYLGGENHPSIAVDGTGNIFITDTRSATYGTPINSYVGQTDVFVAKFNNKGSLIWNTFMGSDSLDYAKDISVDESGNIYVLGESQNTWGTPIDPFGYWPEKGFVAKLDNNGILQWNTFLGGGSGTYAQVEASAITVDGNGDVLIAGASNKTWGSPVNSFVGPWDGFTAKLSNSGVLEWNTFMGPTGYSFGYDIVADETGNSYIAGSSLSSWGNPVNFFAGGSDVFVTKFNSTGVRQWNTFMGSSNNDVDPQIAIDYNAGIYISGVSATTWGTPINPMISADDDVFIAKLNNSGVMQWNTFMGSQAYAVGVTGIDVDLSGNIYLSGGSWRTWGTPVNPLAGASDAFIDKLSNNGVRQWNTFFGSSAEDWSGRLDLDGNGNIYFMGNSKGTWGTPVNAYEGGTNEFVAKIDDSNRGNIVSQARLDIRMPYDINRGCPSANIGCGGPYHGFYKGVCTDLILDAYNAGAGFNIQTALYQDYLVNPGRYRYKSARNAEDMRRFFINNQQFLSNSEPYLPGDIAFFDWDGDGLTNHVLLISEVDGADNPLKMVDASGVIPIINYSGLAFEHNWSAYYEEHVQGHARLRVNTATLKANSPEILQELRATINSESVGLKLFDSKGKSVSETYDENLIASNIEAAIPYIPGGSYASVGAQKIVTVTQPLSNTDQYFVRVEGQANTTYTLLIEALQDTTVTASKTITQAIGTGETQNIGITLTAPSGVISFTAQSPTSSPVVNIPSSLSLGGFVGTSAQLTFTISETGGQQAISNASITATDLSTQYGIKILSSQLSISPANFSVPAGGNQQVGVQVSLANLNPGEYLGSLILASQSGNPMMIPFTLKVQYQTIFLPLIIRN